MFFRCSLSCKTKRGALERENRMLSKYPAEYGPFCLRRRFGVVLSEPSIGGYPRGDLSMIPIFLWPKQPFVI